MLGSTKYRTDQLKASRGRSKATQQPHLAHQELSLHMATPQQLDVKAHSQPTGVGTKAWRTRPLEPTGVTGADVGPH
jgi:hypothetical protein